MIVSTPQEVIVVDEGISDLDDILRQADVAALQHLNISFNRVGRLDGLQRAKSLKLLNVNHNLLQSVDGIETLAALCVLKASHNKLSSLEWVGALSHLSELWISHNKIDLPQLKELKPLTKLHTLLIEANPCCKEPSYKMVVVDLVPSLHRLDTTVVSDDMRTRATAFRNSHEGKALTKDILQRPHPRVKDMEPLKAKPKSAAATLPTGLKRPASEKNQHPNDAQILQAVQPQTPRATTSSAPVSTKAKTSSLEDYLLSFPVQEYIPTAEGLDFSTVSIADAISGLPTFGDRHPSKEAPTASKAKSAEKTTKHTNRAAKKVGVPVTAAAMPSQLLPATSPRTNIEDSPVASNNNGDDDDDDVLDMEQYTRPHPPSRSACMNPPPLTATTPPEVPRHVKSNPSELVVKYTGSNVAAVTVRVDGSAQCRWPNNAIAITVDKEPKGGYRVFGTFKDGNVALSFDGHGVGFINYASGKTMLSTTSAGDGLLMNAQNGGIERQWARGDPPWSNDIAAKLTEHLGVSVSLDANHEYAIRLYFASNGLRHVFVNGFNDAVVCDTVTCDGMFGKPVPPVKKKPPPPKLKHVDLVSAIQRCTSQL